jgi:hypothetical protein
MDEYELLEVELGDLFRVYLEKHRNLDYLQSQLDSHTQREKERMDENERKMREIQRKIKDDELSMMRGEREIVDGGFEDEFDLDEDSDSLQVAPPPLPLSPCPVRRAVKLLIFFFRVATSKMIRSSGGQALRGAARAGLQPSSSSRRSRSMRATLASAAR